MKNNADTPFDLKSYKKTKLLFDSVFQFQKGEKAYELILTGGAVKGGKSFGGIGMFILLANTYPKSRWIIIRKTNKVIERNLKPTWNKLEWMCNSNFPLKKVEGDYVKNFNNGSQIMLMAENYQNDKELNAFKGLDINGWMTDEGNELQEATYNILCVRNGTNRHTCDIPPVAIITCNPTWGWLKTAIYDKFINGFAPDSWLFIPSTARDNPGIPAEQFETWRNTMSRYDYWVFIEGNWGVQKKIGAYLKMFDPDKHLTNITFDKGLPIHITFDENVLPYITCAVWQIDIENKKIIQVAELPMKPPNNSAKKTGIELKKWLQNNDFNERIFIYGDATSRKKSTLGKSFYVQIIEEIEPYFIVEQRILKRNESVSMTGVFVNNILEGLFPWKILINENCGYSISDYVEALEDENGGMKKIRVTDSTTGLSFEKDGHFVDALRYFIIAIFWNEYKRFKKKKL